MIYIFGFCVPGVLVIVGYYKHVDDLIFWMFPQLYLGKEYLQRPWSIMIKSFVFGFQFKNEMIKNVSILEASIVLNVGFNLV